MGVYEAHRLGRGVENLQGIQQDIFSLSALDLKVIHKERLAPAVDAAKDFISTLGSSHEEIQFRTLIEAKMQQYENLSVERLDLESILKEQAYVLRATDTLEGGLEAAVDHIDDAIDTAMKIQETGLIEVRASLGELGRAFEENLLEIWKCIEEHYGEHVELLIEPHHGKKYSLMSGEGKVIFGGRDIHAYYAKQDQRILLRWRVITEILLEEYLHTIHYRRIRELPPALVNMRPHSEEIWVYLEVSRKIADMDLPFDESDRETIDLELKAWTIGGLEGIARKLADIYLFEGNVEDAKRVLREYLGIPVDRHDWSEYIEDRRRRIEMLIDPHDQLEYRLRDALYYEGAEPMERWIDYGKISSRAMEMLGLI